MNIHNIYPVNSSYHLIDEYKDIKEHFVKPEEYWLKCPKCNSLPKLWIITNFRYASCKCAVDAYSNHTIEATSVGDYGRSNDWVLTGFDNDELRKNWNSYVLQYSFLYTNNQYVRSLFNLDKTFYYNPFLHNSSKELPYLHITSKYL